MDRLKKRRTKKKEEDDDNEERVDCDEVEVEFCEDGKHQMVITTKSTSR